MTQIPATPWLPQGPSPGGPDGRRSWSETASRLDLIDHLLILRALMLRDVRMRSAGVGAMGPLLDLLMPIVVMVLHYFVFIALHRAMPAHIPVAYFVLVGFTTWFAFRNTSARVFRGEAERGPILIPGVRPLHFIAAGILWECATSCFLLYSGLLLAAVFAGNSTSPDVVQSVFIFLLATMIGVGYRLFFDALAYVWKPLKQIKKPLSWFAFITSGIYFQAQSGSQNFLSICGRINPLMYLIEPQRQALWPEYPVSAENFTYPLCWALGLLSVGWSLKRAFAHRIGK